MMPFLRQVFLFLVALAALAIVLMMIKSAGAAERNHASDGTRQIVVEETTQDKGAASTDLTEESGAAPVETLASQEIASSPSELEIQAEAEQPEISDRETLARAYLYALYLRAAQRGHGNYGYSNSYSSSYGHDYDHCDH